MISSDGGIVKARRVESLKITEMRVFCWILEKVLYSETSKTSIAQHCHPRSSTVDSWLTLAQVYHHDHHRLV